MKQLYLIHGYNSTAQSHWFPWLRAEVATKLASELTFIQLPKPAAPQLAAWLSALAYQLKEVNEETYFVAHSLGCITLLRYLEEINPNVKIGGVILVSGFSDSLAAMPELTPFVEDKLTYPPLIKKIPKRIVISARDDQLVPTKLSQELATQLSADFYQLAVGGHFLAEEGIQELPIVYELLANLLASNR